MKKFSTPLLEKIRVYVAEYIAEHFTELICYHNIDHTTEVVEACEIIGRQCNLSDSDLEIVLIASWFHDTGYYLGGNDHEKVSAKIAVEYLATQPISSSVTDKVVNCIIATKIPQSPKNLIEKVICDADLFHLSTDKFFDKTELLWKEFTFHDLKLTFDNWLNKSKDFIESHQYQTPYGKKVLLPNQEKNLLELKKRLE